ncbi:MAG: acyl-CoA dehydrogenase family protein [Nitrospirae bacterium]|nr:acyl-CoA dehydrogenase family protein [Nitrospirota bacterium]
MSTETSAAPGPFGDLLPSLFDFAEPHRTVEKMFREYCQKEIEPHNAEMDDGKILPFELIRKLANTFGIPEMVKAGFEKKLKEKNGKMDSAFGGGDPYIGAIFGKELSRVNPGFTMTLGASIGLCGGSIMAKGTPEQKRKYGLPVMTFEKIGCWGMTEPDSGSDAYALKTSAVPDGDHYILNGSKTFITNAPYADIFVIYAKMDRGKEMKKDKRLIFPFVMEKDIAGLTVSKPMHKMGMKASPTGDVFLDNVRVPKDQLLGGEETSAREQSKDVFAGEREGTPTMALGIIERCLEDSIKYAINRKQWGKPIIEFQLIQEKIAKMYVHYENVKNLLFKQIWLKMNKRKGWKEACAAKYYASAACVEVAMEAVQLMGGNGYMREYHVELLARDAKLLQIGGGTSEIQLLNVVKDLAREYGYEVTIDGSAPRKEDA